MRKLNKILIIQAGKKVNEGLFSKYPYSNSTCAAIAAAIPQGIDIEIIDMHVQDIDWDKVDADLALVSLLTTNAPIGFDVALKMKEKGITVIGGGVHAVVMPDECLQYFDAIAIGEAELLIDTILEDFRNNSLKKRYETKEQIDLTKCRIPRYDLLKLRRYAYFGIMASKGCGFDCDFCSSKLVTGPGFRHKTVEQIINEIEYIRSLHEKDPLVPESFFFVDSNLYTDRKFLIELLRALIPLKLKPWGLFASINVARDHEVLDLLQEANCGVVQIGFETINPDSLKDINKKQNNPSEYKEIVKTLTAKGIYTYGTFIFGFDEDDANVFDETFKLIDESGMFQVGLFALTPFPGTRIFDKLSKEGRILHKDWSKYTMINVVFQPKKMTVEEFEREYKQIREKTYDPDWLIQSLKRFKDASGKSMKLRIHEKIALVLTYIFLHSKFTPQTRRFMRKILINKGLIDLYQLGEILPKLQNS